MNPIALLAFIAGIGTSNPASKPHPSDLEKPVVADAGKQHPPKGVSDLKRGGWDGN